MESPNEPVKRTTGRAENVWLPMIRMGFRTVGAVWPAAAAGWAEKLWLTPSRLPLRPKDEKILASGTAFSLSFEGAQLWGWSFGAGPTVYLAHGWAGRAGQFASFIGPLVEAGFRVVAFDMPAHGASGGRQTNAIQMSQALEAVVAHHGAAKAVVAHSFGAVATTLAVSRGLPVERLAFIAAPTNFDIYAERFTQNLGISPRTWQTVQRNVERRLDTRFSEIAPTRLSKGIRAPLLVLHDRDDVEVPIHEGRTLVEHWPGAALVETSGLGHYRILRDAEVVGRIRDFLRQHP